MDKNFMKICKVREKTPFGQIAPWGMRAMIRLYLKKWKMKPICHLLEVFEGCPMSYASQDVSLNGNSY